MWHRCVGLYLLNNAFDFPRLCSACDGNSALCLLLMLHLVHCKTVQAILFQTRKLPVLERFVQ